MDKFSVHFELIIKYTKRVHEIKKYLNIFLKII